MMENNTDNNTDNNTNNTNINMSLTLSQNVYVTINYFIAIVTALIVIVMLIGTIISKRTHCYLKTIHIQFFITALTSCVYHFLNRKPVNCRSVLPFEIFTTFPMVSQLTCIMLCNYLMFKEQFETTKTKIYVFTFIFINWVPALTLEALIGSTEKNKDTSSDRLFDRRDFFCRFYLGGLFYAFLIMTVLFQFYFVLIMVFLYKRLKEVKSTFEGDKDVFLHIYTKIGSQFIFALIHAVVMWIYVFAKAMDKESEESNNSPDSLWYYILGTLYNLSVPFLCYVFIWSSNLRESISQIPCFRCLGGNQDLSSENNGIALVNTHA